ncbi:MAG: saccharopine dehydrogenase NADP-binding domain-containing protein [Saprospirales bacterium]|nr:saccharopine dehydrogenase NADP-binding domain-containing protein [Saprospirales bacterium]
MTRILLIGGYGNAGRCIAEYLLKYTSDTIVILAGRQEEKARAVAQSLSSTFPGRTKGLRIDLADPNSIDEAFQAVDFVVNAAGAIPFTKNVAEGLLRHGKSAIDCQLASPDKTRVLEQMAPAFQEAGICYITDGGFHPGIPAALLRYAATQVDTLEKGNVYSAMKVDWGGLEFSPDTALELIDEFRTNRLAIYQQGKWKDQSVMKVFDVDFGPPFGKQYCAPMFLPELGVCAAQMPDLQETGFYVTGFNKVADYLVLPIVTLGVRLLPRSVDRLLAKFLTWGLQFSRPPYGIDLIADCTGRKNGEEVRFRIRLSHEDGYVITAVPVVACLMQVLDNTIRKPGLWRQAIIVEPVRFLEEVERMGVAVYR